MTSLRDAEPPWAGYRTYPERLNITREVLDRQVEEGRGQKPALLDDRGSLTYEALFRQVNALAWNLNRLGARKGDLILIRMPNSREFAVGFLAATKIGALPVLANSLLSTSELATIFGQAEPRFVITEASRAEAVRELRQACPIEFVICASGAKENEMALESLTEHDVEDVETAQTEAEEPAFIVYTSGTTGKPKGIVHAHRWIVALGDLNRLRLPPREEDVAMATGEWSFISALGHNLLFPLRNGHPGAVLTGRGTPENILASIERYRVTVLYSVATVYRRLLAMPGLEKQFDLGSLRCANATGEALREATYQEWKERVGCELYEHYGVSEFQMVVGQGPGNPTKPGSIGKPLPGVGVAILGEDHRPVARGELGYFAISVKDPGLFLGYYKEPERTEKTFRGGWYPTADLAYEDEDGFLFIAGRSDECFKSRGILISPGEIENALQKHPAVMESAVIPEPDQEIGNKIRAVVVVRENFQPSEALSQSIRETIRTQIAPFKVPHAIEFSPALPKSPVGKILRARLTQRKVR